MRYTVNATRPCSQFVTLQIRQRTKVWVRGCIYDGNTVDDVFTDYSSWAIELMNIEWYVRGYTSRNVCRQFNTCTDVCTHYVHF